MATWIYRVTLDKAPYSILFGRKPRIHIDVITQALDDASFDQGLEKVADDEQRTTQEILKQRHEVTNKARNKLFEHHNARVAPRGSPGAKVYVGILGWHLRYPATVVRAEFRFTHLLLYSLFGP